MARGAIQDHCRPGPAGYKVLRQLVLTDRLQRSPSGKAGYRWVRTTAVDAAAGAEGPVQSKFLIVLGPSWPPGRGDADTHTFACELT
ncbi:hypothetical protein GCM10010327_55550 [Streptomyces nitrosporeus]|nr:hypothetical protein GCM10010327_55550 [Streptomyces nitrosporeus]